MAFKYDICIVGGLGHVGLPLSIMFASKGLKTCSLDINKAAFEKVSKGEMPFMEHDAEPVLKKVLADRSLTLTLDPEEISRSEVVLLVVGTPIDLHMSPELAVENTVSSYSKYFKDGQMLVLRSTLYPGTTDRLHKLLKMTGHKLDIAFCPERIVEGYAMRELTALPQIVSSTTKSGERRATALFKHFTPDIVVVTPIEAEMAKLFANSWRYIKFSTANQFFLLANEAGVDFYKVYDAMTYKYPRAQDLPKAGFASGPCLFKDTVQLNAFNNNNFHIGNAAIMVSEGLPSYVVSKLISKYDLSKKTVGVLGLAFKAGSDDGRDSLSYKLLKFLKFEAKDVLYTDVYIKEPGAVDAQTLVNKSDIIIVATPHKEYSKLKIPKGKAVVDVWNFYGKGVGL